MNVDAYAVCAPDVAWDLNEAPFPWPDNSVREIDARHIFEHLIDWWPAFTECARILEPGGELHIHVPDESSPSALTYRDHHHVFGLCSFHGIQDATHGTNAWAKSEQETIPLTMERYFQVPFNQYEWMTRFPWLLRFCASHLRGFIWEQQFHFRKIGHE